MVRLSAATSSARSVSGSGAATALMPWAASPVITRAQLDPSAQPPWAITTRISVVAILLPPPTVSSTQRRHPAGNGPPDLVWRIFLHKMDALHCHFDLRGQTAGLLEN